MNTIKILRTEPARGYELLDSGEGEKLERFGDFVLRRPDPQALWLKNKSEEVWKSADASFSRESDNAKWKMRAEMPKEWVISFADLNFVVKPTAFKHTGIFPEQEPNWSWIKEKVQSAGRPIRVLNLFAYTGGATLAALSAGAEVTHVDSSKSAITWAKRNAEESKLADKKVRFIEEDARKFVIREIKRGNKYDAIIMDPPAFGHGANNEVWKIEEDFLALVDSCEKILSDNPLFFLINGYSAGYSALAYENNLAHILKKFGGQVESGELALVESSSGRLLPAGIFSRWSK